MTNTPSPEFTITLSVRDYECDMQGVVNNAVYQHYLEHARHEFLKSRGLDFAALTQAGILVVVIRAELDYRRSLRSGDTLTVSVSTGRESRLRMAFVQRIVDVASGATVMDARIIATAVNPEGKPCFPTELLALL